MSEHQYWSIDSSPEGYVGTCSAGYGNRIFGGHTLAHSLAAASHAIGDTRRVSSLHAVFLSPGEAAKQVLYLPTILKQGRSFDAVRVNASQQNRQILETLVSFHDGEPGMSFQDPFPNVIDHTKLNDDPRVGISASKVRDGFRLRTVPGDTKAPEDYTWIKHTGDFTGSPQLHHQATLIFAIDFLITKTAHNPIDSEGLRHRGASLDHAMWFHRPFRVDEWLLIHTHATVFTGSRSLSVASIFDSDGNLVSSATQEGLLRHPSNA